MRVGSYTKRIITTLNDNLGKRTNNNIFIRYKCCINLDLCDIKELIIDNDVKILFYRYSNRDIQGAYAPFLKWIKDIYVELYSQDMTIEEFIEQAGVYSLHRGIMACYIRNGVSYRTEDIIFPEVNYEQRRMRESILNILTFITQKTKLFIALVNLNHAGDSTIEFVNYFIREYKGKNIAFAASFSSEIAYYDAMTRNWNQLRKTMYDKNILVEYEDEIDKADREDEYMRFELMIRENDTSDVMVMLNNMIFFMAFEQAHHYFTVLFKKINQGTVCVEEEDRFKLIAMYALVCMYDNKPEKAVRLCSDMIVQFDLDSNLKLKYIFYYIFSMTQMYIKNCSKAMAYAKSCIETAQELEDEFKIFKAKTLYYLSMYNGWSDRYYTVTPYFVNMSEQDSIIVQLKNHEFNNTLAYFYIYSFDNDEQTMEKISQTMRIEGYLKKAIDIAKELDNRNLIIAAYLKKIIDFSHNEVKYHDYVSLLHEKRLELINNNKDDSFEEYKYDHLAYNCMLGERYEQSNEYNNEYLKYGVESHNLTIIIDALYNLSYLCVDAGNYYLAVKYVVSTLKIIEYVGVQRGCACRTSKLYGFAAIAYFYLDEEYNSNYYISKIERMVSHIINSNNEEDFVNWDDELFMLHFVKALGYKKQGNAVAAQLSFSKAKFHMDRSTEFMFFSYPRYAIERADMYSIMGDENKKKKVIMKAVAYCNLKGYKHRAMLLKYYLEHDRVNQVEYELKLRYYTIGQVLEIVRKEAIKKKRQLRNNDIEFLSYWQEMLDSERIDQYIVINSAMATLRDCYSFDEMLYFGIEGEEFIRYFTTSNVEVDEDTLHSIYDFFCICDNVFATNRNENVFYEYRDLIDIFGINDIMVFAGVPVFDNDEIKGIFIGYILISEDVDESRHLLDDKDIDIIKFALIQLNVALEKIRGRHIIDEVNKKLYNMAVTDLLTGLYNRQGFERALDEYYAVYDRRNVRILYIDLDNFKYYNDTFGHEIGDLVLKLFAADLQRITTDEDIVIRYGGDEFVVVISAYNKTDLKEIAEKIISLLVDGYEDLVQNKLKIPVFIPDEKKLSCSIGIASEDKCRKDDVIGVISNADKALYYVKNNHKGSYATWDINFGIISKD